MDHDWTRRGVLGGLFAGGLAATAVPTVRQYLRQFAPLSGSVWDAATRRVEGTVPSAYGEATVRYDDYGVPHVSAGGERALYFAVGYVHAGDRLFQMDLLRRQLRGRLSAVAGEATVDSDRFHLQMDFAAAAEANVEAIAGTETEAVLEAYVDGVNAAIDRERLPLEFRLLEYEPDPWTIADAMLIEKRIGWTLTGGFEPLRRAAVADEFGASTTERLFPAALEHDAPIVREREQASADRATGGRAGVVPGPRDPAGDPAPSGGQRLGRGADRVGRSIARWASTFESPAGVGSNSWVIAGEHTASGDPIVANDPHLTLLAPPVWYEQHLETDAFSVRGAAFPGQPFVVVGENQGGAWGVTNVGADVCDHYTYETDGDQYRYGDEWRAFDVEERSIPVADGPDRTVEVRKTVHGPMLEREGQSVAVAWTGLTATDTVTAIRQYAHADDVSEFLEATRQFDLPTQNLVYADRQGNTLYWTTGRLPIRRSGARSDGPSGDPVRGDQVFDGSAREGEWAGFEPYGQSSWEGFVPFEEKPGLINPDYVATANQRVIDDPSHYVGRGFASPFRGQRCYDMLDRAVEAGPVDDSFVARMQRDTRDERAPLLVPDLLAVRSDLSNDATALVDEFEDWSYRMDRGSRAALAFAFALEAFRTVVFEEPFAARDLDATPTDWVLLTLPADDPWFEREEVPDRREALVEAAERAADRIADRGDDVYGDYNRPAIDHPFELDFLGYDRRPTDGSPATLRNVRVESDVGSSWAMIAALGGASRAILPGGNSGEYFSSHYDDQLPLWLDGEYKSMERTLAGTERLRFEDES